MPQKLKNLRISKVALCARGMNPGAEIVFFKGDVAKATFDEIQAAQMMRQALWKIYDLCYTLQEAVASSLADDDPNKNIRVSVKQFSSQVETVLEELESGSYKKEDVETLKTTALTTLGKVLSHFNLEAVPMKKARSEMTKEELLAELEAVEKQHPPKEEEPKPEDVLKSLPPETAAAITKILENQNVLLAKANADAAKALEDSARAQNAANVEKESRERLEFEKVAQAEIPHLPGTVKEKADMLYDLHKNVPEATYKAMLTTMKAGNASMESLMKETGTTVGGDSSKSALEQLEEKAEEFRKSKPELTREQAFDTVQRQNPDLVTQYRAERRSRDIN